MDRDREHRAKGDNKKGRKEGKVKEGSRKGREGKGRGADFSKHPQPASGPAKWPE